MRLILASGSATRRQMLEQAGLTFEVVPPDTDEEAVKLGWTGTPAGLALDLARRKALSVSGSRPDALVIGADQVLELDGRMFSKPGDMAAARTHLAALRGRTHYLRTAMVLARGDDSVFAHESAPALTLFDLTDAALDAHVAGQSPDVLQSVGGYRVETADIRLFRSIEGGWHDVLGLPLLALQAWLRDEGLT